MTGEMGSIDKNGLDSNGDSWPLQAAIAKRLGGELCPFDRYQGPYIWINGVRLWVVSCSREGTFTPYDTEWVCIGNERTQTYSKPFWPYADTKTGMNTRAAVRAARSVLSVSK